MPIESCQHPHVLQDSENGERFCPDCGVIVETEINDDGNNEQRIERSILNVGGLGTSRNYLWSPDEKLVILQIHKTEEKLPC